MATATVPYTIQLPEDYDAQSKYETPFRGYLSGVVVQLEDGSRYPLFFMDPVRLKQDLDASAKLGRSYLAEVNLIVLPEVTTASVKQAVQGLWQDGYFQHLKPL